MYENLLESSGCSTIRFLLKDKGLKEKMNIEKSLRDIGVNDFEYANDLFGAMSVEPEVKYLPIRNLLDEYVQKGLLGYEEVLLRHQF